MIPDILFNTSPARGRQRIIFWSLLALLAISLRVAFSWTSLTHLPPTGDEASSVLLAKFIADGERPLLFIGQPYQFPFESYLLAPFVSWMPRTAIGVRAHTLLLSGISVLIFIVVAWKMFPVGKRWPTILLLMFPSAYWLQHQSGYTPPQYAMTAFLSAIVILLTILAWQSRKQRIFLILLAGLFSGLLISNHLLGIAIISGSVFMLSLVQGPRRIISNISFFGAGLLIGMTPYLVAKLTIPGAYEAVTQQVTIVGAWHALTEYAFTRTLPGTMGINSTLFTDVYDLLGWPDIIRQAFLAFFLLTVSVAVFARAHDLFGQTRNESIVFSKPVDLFLVSVVISFILFIFSNRAYEHGFRFLLPIAWCFPFVFGYTLLSSSSVTKKVLLVFFFACLTINISSSIHLVRVWSEPRKIQTISDTLPLDNVLSHLEKRGVKYCYASFWHAYRITLETDEKIICSQPYNERFLFWPLPYKSTVDKQIDTPYILTNTPRAKLSAQQFISHLKHENIQWKITKFRPYYIFSEFTHQNSRPVVKLFPGQYTIRSGFETDDAIAYLTDGDQESVWSSNTLQISGDLLILDLHKHRRVQHISLYYSHRAINHPKIILLTGLKDDTTVIQKSISHNWSRFILENNKPIYGGLPFVIRLESIPILDKIILEIIEPDKTKTWDIADIDIGILP